MKKYLMAIALLAATPAAAQYNAPPRTFERALQPPAVIYVPVQPAPQLTAPRKWHLCPRSLCRRRSSFRQCNPCRCGKNQRQRADQRLIAART